MWSSSRSGQTEEYASSNYAEFSVNPTVMMTDYILEDYFQKNDYKAIVEETSIKEILNQHNWSYSNSYKASRLLLEQRIIEYPTLKYFIDIHRDSLKKEKTTITIDDKKYAKILFVVGLEHKNYEKNLKLANILNERLKRINPCLSRGIYKKSNFLIHKKQTELIKSPVCILFIIHLNKTYSIHTPTPSAPGPVWVPMLMERGS